MINIPTLKFLALSALTLLAGSMTVLLSQAPSDSAEPFERVVREPEGEPVASVVALRIAAKYRVARDVIAGRFSLLEGAALFGALNEVSPRAPELSLFRVHDSVRDVPGRTEEERLCRQVITYAGWELLAEPERANAVVGRLKADFNAKLCQGGAIQLPDSSSLPTVQELLEDARVELTHGGVLSSRVTAQADRGTDGQDHKERAP